MKFLPTFALIFLLIGCNSDQSYDYNYQPRAMFKTTPSSRIYFKNMRSAYYEQLSGRPDSMDVYRLRKYPQPADRPILQAIIADNWIRDEAYLLLEFNEFPVVRQDTFSLEWTDKNGQKGASRLEETTPEAQLRMSEELVEAINADYIIMWRSPRGKTYELFRDETERNAFRTTWKDFQRMTAR